MKEKNKSRYHPTKTLSQLIEQLENTQQVKTKAKRLNCIDLEEVKKSMKAKWKNAGCTNREFNPIVLHKFAPLTQWQTSRINMAERSYKPPKSYRGLKCDVFSRQFSEPALSQHSKKFQAHLRRTQKQFESHLFGPKNKESAPAQSCIKFQRSIDTLFGFSTDLILPKSRVFKTIQTDYS